MRFLIAPTDGKRNVSMRDNITCFIGALVTPHLPMRILHGFQPLQRFSHCALTIGNFDGVHRGHHAMLALLRSEADMAGLRRELARLGTVVAKP